MRNSDNFIVFNFLFVVTMRKIAGRALSDFVSACLLVDYLFENKQEVVEKIIIYSNNG